MATYLLRNSLCPGRVVKCTITFRQIVNKGEEGEPVWLIEIGTGEPHKNGGSISPVFIHYTSGVVNLDEAIRSATTIIANQVDWGVLEEDARPPFVIDSFPAKNQNNVSIYSNVTVDIKDLFPSAGIDPDSIKVMVNDFDVTNEVDIQGTPFEYKIIWSPKDRVLDYY
jgi:hypothetical protein